MESPGRFVKPVARKRLPEGQSRPALCSRSTSASARAATGVIAAEASRDASGHFNVLHILTGARADVYLAGKDPLARRGLDGRRQVERLGRPTSIAPPEYVILHKLRFRQQGASERHLRDIRAMLRVLGKSVDVAALERDALELGLAAVWAEMKAVPE